MSDENLPISLTSAPQSKNAVCDILAFFAFFAWKDTMKYVLSNGKIDFSKIFLKVYF